jgi:hypothetical protein
VLKRVKDLANKLNGIQSFEDGYMQAQDLFDAGDLGKGSVRQIVTNGSLGASSAPSLSSDAAQPVPSFRAVSPHYFVI